MRGHAGDLQAPHQDEYGGHGNHGRAAEPRKRLPWGKHPADAQRHNHQQRDEIRTDAIAQQQAGGYEKDKQRKKKLGHLG